jgi:mRNA interferase YafQ
MLEIRETKRFKKDLRLMKKRGKSFDRYKKIIILLINEKELPSNFGAHKLTGEWADFWEGHIEPDWLLIYQKTKTSLILTRTGTHSDLFS